MKIRSGFVSNSSSSSFIIIRKHTNISLEDALIKAISTEKDSLFYKLSHQVASKLADLAKETTLKEYVYNYDEVPSEEYLKYITNGGKIYTGYASDEDGDIEAILCNIGIEYEDKNIIISKEEAY